MDGVLGVRQSLRTAPPAVHAGPGVLARDGVARHHPAGRLPRGACAARDLHYTLRAKEQMLTAGIDVRDELRGLPGSQISTPASSTPSRGAGQLLGAAGRQQPQLDLMARAVHLRPALPPARRTRAAG